MTTKPKTRKAPAPKAATHKPAAKETPKVKPREINELDKLTARWHFLEAEQKYKGTIAPTYEKSDAAYAMHEAEQKKIEDELTTMLPETFSEVCCLLEFAMRYVDIGLSIEGVDLEILKNVRSEIRRARCNDLDAERARIEAMHAQDEAERYEAMNKAGEYARLALESTFIARRARWGALTAQPSDSTKKAS